MKVEDILNSTDLKENIIPQVAAMTFKELAELVESMEDEISARTKKVKKLNEVMGFVMETVVPDKLEEEGMSNLTVKMDAGGKRRWQTSEQARCSIIAAKRPDMYKWLQDNGHGSLIADTVNSSTFKAFVLEQMKKGNELPTENFNLHMYSKASLVKA